MFLYLKYVDFRLNKTWGYFSDIETTDKPTNQAPWFLVQQLTKQLEYTVFKLNVKGKKD